MLVQFQQHVWEQTLGAIFCSIGTIVSVVNTAKELQVVRMLLFLLLFLVVAVVFVVFVVFVVVIVPEDYIVSIFPLPRHGRGRDVHRPLFSRDRLREVVLHAHGNVQTTLVTEPPLVAGSWESGQMEHAHA